MLHLIDLTSRFKIKRVLSNSDDIKAVKLHLGYVLRKNVSNRKMITSINDPRVLIIDNHLQTDNKIAGEFYQFDELL